MDSRRVLVVDDERDVLVYLRSLLEDNGYLVRTANNAAQAAAAIESEVPAVVLIDVLMPGRSGLELLLRLRRDARWSSLPLVVMTGMDQVLQDDCQSYLGSHHGIRGPDAVLGKPIDPQTLLAVLRTLGEGRQEDLSGRTT